MYGWWWQEPAGSSSEAQALPPPSAQPWPRGGHGNAELNKTALPPRTSWSESEAVTVTGTKHCTGMEGGPEGRSWGRGRRWDVKSRGGGWALQGRDDGDLGKVMLVMEEEELQDLDGVVRGKAREGAGSPRKAPGSPLWVWHIHWPQSPFPGAPTLTPHPTEASTVQAPPWRHWLGMGPGPLRGVRPRRPLGVGRSRWRKGYPARGMRTLLAAWPQPFQRELQAAGGRAEPPSGRGARWSLPQCPSHRCPSSGAWE